MKKGLLLVLTIVMLIFSVSEVKASVVDSGKMIYNDELYSTTFDIQGYHNGIIKATTYNNSGYGVVLDIGGARVNFPNRYILGNTFTTNGIDFKLDLSFISEGNYVKVKYTVTNNSDVSKTYGIATHSDTQIGTNDSAQIQKTDKGIVMLEGGASGAQFNVITKNSYGVTDVDTLWFGLWYERNSQLFNDTPSSTSSGDSGLAYSWKNRNITPGETIVHSVLFGIGPVNEPPVINSHQAGSLGNKLAGEIVTLSGSVTDPESDAVSLFYAIDGEDYTTNPLSLDGFNNYSFDFVVPDMALFSHDIELVAIDAKGAISSTKITYTQIAYNVSIFFNGNTTNVQVANGSNLTRLIGTRADGYEVVGLFKDSALSIPWNPASDVLTDDLTIYASYSLINYNITYNLNSGTNSASNPSTYTTEDTIIFAEPTKVGYTFNGWYSNASFTGSPITQISAGGAVDMAIYAKYTLSQYALEYVDYDGTVLQTANYDYNANLSWITAPTVSPRTGYIFNAWSRTVPSTMPASNVTITATYIVREFTITFASNGGSLVSPITQNYNTVVTAPSAPIKTGYTFGGWYSNAGLTVDYTFTTMPDENITLYAKWNINSYTITFASNDGSLVSAIMENYNTAVTAPSAPTKTGYTFGGWYSNASLTSLYAFTTMPAENITLYAKWNINSYTITFASNGGTLVSPITQNYNTVVTAPSAPTKSGYTFSGWYSDAGLTTPYIFITMPAANITLYAKWNINSYTMTFASNGGSLVSPITQNYNTAVLAPSAPTRTGYIFDRWYSDAGLTVDYTFTTMPSENTTLYAKWNINSYTITFASNGGSLVSPLTQNYNTAVLAPSAPTKTGYAFDRWYSDAGLTVDYTFTTMPASNTILYAKWIANSQTMSFNANGGTAIADIIQDYDSILLAPTSPTRTGYTLAGWYSDAALTSQYVFNTMPLSMSLYAKWTANSQTITFEPNGGTAVTDIIQDYDSILLAPINPTRTGYTLAGWYSDEELTSQYVFNSMPLSTTLYGKWTADSQTMSFNTNGGTAVSSVVQDYDSVLLAPISPIRTGYTFVGWYSDEELTSQYVLNTMPLSMALYAKWSANSQTMTFVSNGGTAVTDIIQDFDSVLLAPINPTRTGYTFAGWYSDEELTSQYVFNTMPLSTTLYGKWTADNQTMTFVSNGGTAVSSVVQDFDSVLLAPINPTRTGYTFAGWYSDEELTSPYVFNTMPLSIALYAKWSANSQTMTFVSNGGTSVADIVQDFDSILLAPTSPTKIGYIFAGWYSNEELTSLHVFNTMPLSMALYAKWAADSQTITFNSNYGTAIADIVQNYESILVAPINPTKTGYIFAGWYSDEELTSQYVFNTMPLSTTLYAEWAANRQTMIFDSNGGTAVANIIQDYYSDLVAPSDPIKVGYIFGGWYSDARLSKAYVFNVMPLSQTLYAQWIESSYDIVFNNNSGIGLISNQTINYGASENLAANTFTKIGYTFSGWNTVPNGSGDRYLDSSSFTMNVLGETLYAQWTANSQTITFDSNGGTVVTDIIQNYDSILSVPTSPTRTGYTFSGWYSDYTLLNVYVFSVMPLSTTLYAKWNINEYTLQYLNDDGTIIQTEKFAFNSYLTDVSAPTSPSRVGYTFAGWDRILPTKMPANDITAIATYTINQYTLEFIDYDGTVLSSQKYNYDADLTSGSRPENPSRVGYVFNGWDKEVPANMPTEKVTLTAQWKLVVVKTETIEGLVVTGLDKVIDESLYLGKTYEIELNCTIVEEKQDSQDDALINEQLNKKEKVLIIDISLILIVNENGLPVRSLLTETNEPISITIGIPKAQQGHSSYRILRIHEGEPMYLETIYDAENQTLTFETDLFSTYAIVYETSNSAELLWLLVLVALAPIGYFGYRYKNVIKKVFKK